MGMKHVATAAVFSKYAGFSNYPLLSGFGLTDLFVFGVDQATSVVNLAPGGTNLTVTGTPTYGANSATCTSAASFATSTVDTLNDTTLCGVFTPVTSSPGATVVSNFTGALADTFGLWTANSTVLNLAANVGTVDNTTSPAVSGSAMRFAAAGFVGTTKFVAVGINGVLNYTSETFTRTRHATEAFHIAGDTYTPSINDTVTVAAAAIHKAGLSVEQLTALYDYYRWFYAQRGVTVS